MNTFYCSDNSIHNNSQIQQHVELTKRVCTPPGLVGFVSNWWGGFTPLVVSWALFGIDDRLCVSRPLDLDSLPLISNISSSPRSSSKTAGLCWTTLSRRSPLSILYSVFAVACRSSWRPWLARQSPWRWKPLARQGGYSTRPTMPYLRRQTTRGWNLRMVVHAPTTIGLPSILSFVFVVLCKYSWRCSPAGRSRWRLSPWIRSTMWRLHEKGIYYIELEQPDHQLDPKLDPAALKSSTCGHHHPVLSRLLCPVKYLAEFNADLAE